MDLTAYINSGILKLYVLDRLSPDERRRVESYAAEYPEVKAEIEQIELDLEHYAVLHGQATPPPPSVLTSVLRRIEPATSPVAPTDSATAHTPPPPTRAEQGANPLLWILLIALALALAGLAYFYFQSQDRLSEVNRLTTEFTALEEDCQQVADNYEADQQQIQLLTDIDTRGVVLAGTDNAPDSRAQVFYNRTQNSVLFTAANLPTPPTGRQYQLWALDSEGNPQDLGVLDRNLTGEQLINIGTNPDSDTQAFAITLEVEGGRPTPDLSQLQVIGTVES